QVAPNRIRAQAQGLLVLFTLGLGMLIGAQIAGIVEARYTPEAAGQFATAAADKAREIKDLENLRAGVIKEDLALLNKQISQLEAEKEDLRRSELKSLEWTPIWTIPAIFAAIVLVLFIVIFRERSRTKTAG
ncbi:MAG: putative nucleoside transporter YegT, partial [Acidobacteriota bacterium]